MRLRVREAASAAILDAAEEVAAQRGVEATSIAAIAERAGVAVGTLYNYFEDKDALIAALFKTRREEMLPRLEDAAVATQHLAFEDRLQAYVAQVLAVFESHRRFVQVAMSVDPGAIKIRGRQLVLQLITDALVDILRPVAPTRAPEYARMLFGALKSLAHWRVERSEPLSGDAHLLVSTFLQGMACV
jgi:AcrR family transcriptional regulator